MEARLDRKRLLFCGRPLLGRLLEALLDSLSVSLEITTDGESLQAAARRRRPELVLVQLPPAGLDTDGLCERLQHLDCPRILLQAEGNEQSMCPDMAVQCDCSIGLPLDGVQLLRRVDELLGLVGRRRSVRIPASMAISFEDFRGIFIEQARDISVGGMFIEMQQPLEVGTPLRLSFQLPEPMGGQVLAWAKVVRRVTAEQDQVPGIGVRFVSLDPVHRRRLLRLAEQMPRSEPGDDWAARLEMNAWPQARKPEDELLEAFDRELRMLEEQRGRLVKRLQQLETQRLLAETITGADARVASRACLDVLQSLGGVAAAAVYRLTAEGDPGECLAGLPDGNWPAGGLSLPGWRRRLEEGKVTAAILETATGPEGLPRTLVAAPLLAGERRVGVVLSTWSRQEPPGGDFLQLVELCAGQLAGTFGRPTVLPASGSRIP